METLLTTDPEAAARVIKRGGLVAFPTETVYGLGADALNAAAVASIFTAKQRPQDNPLIVHVGDKGQIDLLARSVPVAARSFIDEFFPGPLTVVLPRSAAVPDAVTAGLDSVGVRMPRHPLAAEFLRHCGTPVAAPSANLSGRPSPTTWPAVFEDLDGRIDCILQGGATEIGLESTVVDCTSDIPQVLRLGAVSIEQLRAVAPATLMFDPQQNDDAPRSPGMKHRHYSPRARVVIASGAIDVGERSAAFIGLTPTAGAFALTKLCASVDDYANSLFEFFRECDRFGIEIIYCERVAETGIGAALMDRIIRSAEI
jgi:L-threonylcarbamoyladenylate synthase